MEPFLYHVFVCDQKKPEGVPGCAAAGSGKVIEALRKEIAAQRLLDEVQITTCGSLGLCGHGPNMIVYPAGIWYSGVRPEDVPEIVRAHFKEGSPVERLIRTDTSALRAEILANRERRASAQRAREAAGAIPEDLSRMIRGFQENRVVLSAIELDVFSAVGSGATAEEVSVRTGTDARAVEILLNALAAIGLLAKSGTTFQNTPTAARYLAAGSPDDARLSLMHMVHLWPRWSTLTECVRAGTSVTYREAPERGSEWTEAFIAAMDRNARERAPVVLGALDISGVKRMLDVGGGSGAYSIAFARANPDLRAVLFDLPTVVPIAGGNVEKAGLSDRVTLQIGDLRTDDFGGGYDLVFVSAICHMLDPEGNRRFVKKCRDALAPGGRLVIQDFILEPDRTSPRSAALFAVNMLVGTRGGSSYSVEDYAGWMRDAAFQSIEHVGLPGPTGLMIGAKA